MTMIFEEGAKVKFDERKYVSNHLRLLRDVYGDSVEDPNVLTQNTMSILTRMRVAGVA